MCDKFKNCRRCGIPHDHKNFSEQDYPKHYSGNNKRRLIIFKNWDFDLEPIGFTTGIAGGVYHAICYASIMDQHKITMKETPEFQKFNICLLCRIIWIHFNVFYLGFCKTFDQTLTREEFQKKTEGKCQRCHQKNTNLHETEYTCGIHLDNVPKHFLLNDGAIINLKLCDTCCSQLVATFVEFIYHESPKDVDLGVNLIDQALIDKEGLEPKFVRNEKILNNFKFVGPDEFSSSTLKEFMENRRNNPENLGIIFQNDYDIMLYRLRSVGEFAPGRFPTFYRDVPTYGSEILNKLPCPEYKDTNYFTSDSWN